MCCDIILLQACLFSDHIIILHWQVHIKWSNRITKLLVQCLESSEYIEIRNALTVLTKISSVFPVIRKTGINLERRVSAFSDTDSVVCSVASPMTNKKVLLQVSKIKGDEREDLKVLAIGVSAALAARKVFIWKIYADVYSFITVDSKNRI